MGWGVPPRYRFFSFEQTLLFGKWSADDGTQTHATDRVPLWRSTYFCIIIHRPSATKNKNGDRTFNSSTNGTVVFSSLFLVRPTLVVFPCSMFHIGTIVDAMCVVSMHFLWCVSFDIRKISMMVQYPFSMDDVLRFLSWRVYFWKQCIRRVVVDGNLRYFVLLCRWVLSMPSKYCIQSSRRSTFSSAGWGQSCQRLQRTP